MRLAEALQRRTDLKADLDRIQRRLSAVSLVEEGSKPAEDPKDLLNKHLNKSEQLESLAIKIAVANQNESITFGGHSIALSNALAKREQLRSRVNFLRDLHEDLVTGYRKGYYGNTESKVTRTLEPTTVETQLNHSATKLRELNSAIQEKNWTTDLEKAVGSTHPPVD